MSRTKVQIYTAFACICLLFSTFVLGCQIGALSMLPMPRSYEAPAEPRPSRYPPLPDSLRYEPPQSDPCERKS